MFNDAKIYEDTIEIVKSAVSSGNANAIANVDQLIQVVYDSLQKLNKQGDNSLPLPI